MPDPATPRHTEPPELVDAIRERSVLMGLSYRLLGSLVDAEDETYIRWFRLSEQERRAVTRARAYRAKQAAAGNPISFTAAVAAVDLNLDAPE